MSDSPIDGLSPLSMRVGVIAIGLVCQANFSGPTSLDLNSLAADVGRNDGPQHRRSIPIVAPTEPLSVSHCEIDIPVRAEYYDPVAKEVGTI